MASLQERIVDLLRQSPGLTDREIANALLGATVPQQPVNQACHRLRSNGTLERRKRQDGLIGNYMNPSPIALQPTAAPTGHRDADALSEDSVKKALDTWLRRDGWDTRIAWGQSKRSDIDAQRGAERWIIEVK